MELTIYIGLLASILVVLVSLAFIIIGNKTKQGQLLAIQFQGNHAIERMSEYIRKGRNLRRDEGTVFNNFSAVLQVETDVDKFVQFSLDKRSIQKGNSTYDYNTLVFTDEEGSSIDFLSDDFEVNRFSLEDLSTTNTEAVALGLELSTISNSAQALFNTSYEWETSVTVRAPQE